jgi:hypothetical protein
VDLWPCATPFRALHMRGVICAIPDLHAVGSAPLHPRQRAAGSLGGACHKGPLHRRPRLRHRTHRRGEASAASRPPQARARVVDNVCLSAQPPADRSVQRLIRRRRWTAPANGWAARPRSGPPSARQRARTDAAPCFTSSPPKGLKKEGTGTAALCPCHSFLSPPNPLQGLCGSLHSWR